MRERQDLRLFVDALDSDVLYEEFEANLNAEGDGTASIRVVDADGTLSRTPMVCCNSGQGRCTDACSAC